MRLFRRHPHVLVARFLVESTEHAVLYTGDVRAEPFLLNQLVKNPILSDFVSLFGAQPARTLDAIYLDTSAVMSRARILSKVSRG